MQLDELFSLRKKKWIRLKEMRDIAAETVRECPGCGGLIPEKELRAARYVCPGCGRYFPMPPEERIREVLDEGTFTELFREMETRDPLSFPGYEGKLSGARKKTGTRSAFTAGTGKIRGMRAAVGILDGAFLMGSMGSAEGGKIARLAEYAGRKKLPLILFSASGGARMQEGLFSLMQMARTASAVERFRENGGFMISVLTDPTTGGVSASYANLGDIILAEPGALICFAGPRVIEQTIGSALPEGFQRAEFLLEHGMIDRIVERKDLRAMLARLLRFHAGAKTGARMKTDAGTGSDAAEGPEDRIRTAAEERTAASEAGPGAGKDSPGGETEDAGGSLTPYARVQLARRPDRPGIREFIKALFPSFVELHGDRLHGDDPAMVGGIALFHGMPVTVIGQRKGRNTDEQIRFNFGMASPEGYRKAMRLMRQAEKFHRPVITLIDTPGAYPGAEAESGGQSTAIAECLAYMTRMKTPSVAIVTGEGSSGGALAIGAADRVFMLENAVYAILSPEGFASILWKDAKRAAEAAELMKLTAEDLLEAGMIDGILPEGERLYPALEETLERELKKLCGTGERALLSRRYARYASYGG